MLASIRALILQHNHPFDGLKHQHYVRSPLIGRRILTNTFVGPLTLRLPLHRLALSLLVPRTQVPILRTLVLLRRAKARRPCFLLYLRRLSPWLSKQFWHNHLTFMPGARLLTFLCVICLLFEGFVFFSFGFRFWNRGSSRGLPFLSLIDCSSMLQQT